GLGGGSSNGTFMLRLLNEKFDLGATNDQLKTYALQLGSDCPFFIINKPALATGRGEKMTPIDLDLAGHHIVLVNPGIHVSTGWAFSQIAPAPHQIPLSDIVHHPMSEWEARGMINDLEAPVLEKYPEIRHIKESLYQKGASFAAMSGSGSTVFGIFSQLPDHSPNEYPSNYLVKILSF
ncbi:MAG TPA: hypothetical protein VK907_13795, partial [Phnomibacter sp.]|nr:hypothetical protein [Phnomibacter sp.]